MKVGDLVKIKGLQPEYPHVGLIVEITEYPPCMYNADGQVFMKPSANILVLWSGNSQPDPEICTDLEVISESR